MNSTPPSPDIDKGRLIIPSEINDLDRLEAAQFYHGNLGFAVHPLYPPNRGSEREAGKKPLLKGWRQHSDKDVSPAYLHEHFGSTCHNNIGCVVRPPFVVVDLDSKPDAGASVATWLETQPELSSVPRERTAGGVHVWFVCRDLPDSVLAGKNALVHQINDKVTAELYFDGLNLVLSPSVHKSGHRYLWEVTGAIPEVSWQRLQHWFGFPEPSPGKQPGKRRQAPWRHAFRGDTRTLDIVALFKEDGRLGIELDPDTGKWAVRCPWESEHSNRKVDYIGSDTVVFGKPIAGFRCLHAHCSERKMKEVCEWFEKQHPGLVDKHCREQRVWEEGQTEREGRPRILLPGVGREDSEFASRIAAVIAPKRIWFNKSNRIVTVSLIRHSEKIKSLGFSPLEPIEARTAVEDHLQTGILQKSASGDMEFAARTMSRECAAGLLASPQFKREMPEITRILDLPLPIRLDDGQIAYPNPGYDPRFRIYTDPQAPKLRPMPQAEALELIRRTQEGFGFSNDQSLTHSIARLITPYCRGLMGWDGRFPLWHFSGNRPRAGKDYLAGVTQIVYEGRTIEDAPLERESEETRKRITAALMSGRRMVHFANCQGHLQDACFIGAITSKTFGARNLGSTEAKSDLTLPNEIEFSISANIGLTFRPDVEPRTRRIALEFPEDNANGRTFPIPDLHEWVAAHRADILSAIHSLVALWIEAGCPPGMPPLQQLSGMGQCGRRNNEFSWTRRSLPSTSG